MLKRLFLLPLGLLAFSPLAQADLQWSGSMNTRFRAFNYDDGMNSVNNTTQNLNISKQKLRAWDYRGNLFGKTAWENWEFFSGVRLSNTIVNDYNTFNGNADGVVKLEYAAGRYTWKTDDMAAIITAGRQDTPFFYDKLAQHVFDTDMRWDGFNEEFKWKNFGFITNQFFWGAKSQGVMNASSYSNTEASDSVAATQSGFAVQYGFSPYGTFKIADEIETTLAVAFYNWTNSENLTNTIHGGYASSLLNPNADTGAVSVNNAKVWHVYNAWKLPFNLHAVGEWTGNKKSFYSGTAIEADTKSYTAGAGYGTIKKAGDFAFDYFYVNKGLASMVGAIPNGGIKPDNKGHMFYARYSPWTKLSVAVVTYFLEEKADKTAAGLASTVHQKQTQWYFVVGAAI